MVQGLSSADLAATFVTVNWGDGATDYTHYAIQSDGDVDATHVYATAGNYADRTIFCDAGGNVIRRR